MEQFTFDELPTVRECRIVAVGVGDSGSNTIKHMMNEKKSGIELMIANTDEQNCYEELHRLLDGVDIVFIVTGLGGETGTGAASIIAKIAKGVGALTISVVTKPFSFEGCKRLKLAEEGLEELKNESDSIVVIPNDKLLSVIDPKLGIKKSFKIVDSILARVVSGISGVILVSGENDINLDLVDLKTIMNHRWIALIGIGEWQGENAASKAINDAINFAMLDGKSVRNASGVLIHFTMHPEFHFMELIHAMDVIHNSVDERADVIFGTTTDETIPIDYIKITLIVTGIENIAIKACNNVYE